MQSCRELQQRVKVAVVGCFEGLDVFAAVVPGDDNGQVVVLHQAPDNQGPRHATVAVGERVDLRKPVVEPRGHQQGMVSVRLAHVLAVPREQVSESTCSGGQYSWTMPSGLVGLLAMVLKAPAWRRASNHCPNWFMAR